jgi:toxin ParE1/3/4
MRLRWTAPAARDLYRIVQRIQQDSLTAADRVAETLYGGCDGLRDFPFRGRRGRIQGTRELVFPGLPYVLVYRVENQEIDVLRIYHAAQDWP